nr:hypothetical protein [uncultured Gellertiella sp.]
MESKQCAAAIATVLTFIVTGLAMAFKPALLVLILAVMAVLVGGMVFAVYVAFLTIFGGDL